MASPSGVVLESLTVDSHELMDRSTAGFIVWIRSGLFDGTEPRGRDDTLIGIDGLFQRNRKPSRRGIVLEGFVGGVGAGYDAALSDYYDKRADLEAWFPVDARVTLEAELSDGRTASIVALTLPPGVVADEPVPGACELTIMLESIVPVWTWTPAGS
jgi:hypothetical protein